MDNGISIIVPVYNAEKTIKACVESVLKQSYREWNLILVDDGSKDRSLEIARGYENSDSRISVVHQSNGGSTSARYAGMRQVQKTKYVTFLDADDCLTHNALELMHRKAEEHQADIVCGNVRMVSSFFKLNAPVWELQKRECVFRKGNDGWLNLMQSFYGVTLFPSYMHSKLYRREIVEKSLEFEKPCHFFQEDVAYNLQAFLQSDCVVGTPEVVYFYKTGGATSRFMPDFLSDCISLYNFKLKTIEKNRFPQDFAFTTAVELKNELWTWLSKYVQKYGEDRQTVINEVKKCCDINEIIEAVNHPKSDNSGKNGFRELVIKKDIDRIVDMLYRDVMGPVSKAKRFVRRIIEI